MGVKNGSFQCLVAASPRWAIGGIRGWTNPPAGKPGTGLSWNGKLETSSNETRKAESRKLLRTRLPTCDLRPRFRVPPGEFFTSTTPRPAAGPPHGECAGVTTPQVGDRQPLRSAERRRSGGMAG